jgi:diaminohydroxyphosphoribosylaminopyrimidine deaminase/5-amino-6-(5-phosphoribosylamino)uracil reductase
VTRGVLIEECVEANRPFFTWAERGRPWIVLKAAVSADGRVGLPSGESRWITGAAARADGHRLRNELDAILVGIGTVLADDPRLTVRGIADSRDPIRVVLDSRLRTPPDAALLPAMGGGGRAIIATTTRAAAVRRRRLEASGAEVWTVRANRHGQVDPRAVVAKLAAAGVASLLVEGGPRVHGSFVAAGIADEVRLYLAPVFLGAGPAWLGDLGISRLARAPRWQLHGDPIPLGSDRLIRMRPDRD